VASVLILAYSGEERPGVSNAYRYPSPGAALYRLGWSRSPPSAALHRPEPLTKIPMEKEPIRLTPVARKNLAGGSYARFGAEFWPQTNALLHVDDVAVLGEPVDKGGCQVSVLQKGTPLAEAQIGSD
jgi:hypothetical protein